MHEAWRAVTSQDVNRQYAISFWLRCLRSGICKLLLWWTNVTITLSLSSELDDVNISSLSGPALPLLSLIFCTYYIISLRGGWSVPSLFVYVAELMFVTCHSTTRMSRNGSPLKTNNVQYAIMSNATNLSLHDVAIAIMCWLFFIDLRGLRAHCDFLNGGGLSAL